MKEMNLLVWLTQLGLSAALPLGGFVFLGIWLHRWMGWGSWTVWTGLALGLILGIRGFWDALKMMETMSRRGSPREDPPPAFNDHD